MPGPVPKRSDQRRRRNAPAHPVAKIKGAASKPPELGVDGLNPLVVAWFAALADGAEARFYTPAIWQRARIVAVMLSRLLESDKPSATMYAALQSDMASLLVDPAELRRLHIEIQADEPEQVGGSNVIDWRARASASA